MKRLKVFICSIFALAVFSSTSTAQQSLAWNDAEPTFQTNVNINVSLDFTFVNKNRALNLGSILKRYALARGIRMVRNPLVVTRDGKCYIFRCVSAGGCNDCKMLWKDKNGDGKIQPRRELRCACPGLVSPRCKITVDRANCR